MHEVSIAEALLAQVRQHTPAGTRLTHVRVEAGPLQSIDPEAFDMAWQAVTCETDLAGSVLEFTALPWNVTCATCQRQWTSRDPFETCSCGSTATTPAGSRELHLLSLEVEPLAPNPYPA